MYELHVRGFTAGAGSGVRFPGTYRGLAEKIEYLKALGITAVELLPIDEFDENDCRFVNPLTGEPLRNYWGYNPIAFGAPKAAYAHNPERSATRGGSSARWSSRSTTQGMEVYPRRGVQPHGGTGLRRADLQLPRPGQHSVSTCSTIGATT